MKDHPLTPMTDANLVRVLARQTKREVGLVEHKTVRRGVAAIRARFDELRARSTAYAIVDALADEDLMAIGAACADLALVTAGSGVALGLPQNFFAAGLMQPRTDAGALPAAGGKPAVLAGSCSAATRQQVARMAERHPAHALDPVADPDPARLAAKALTAIAPALEAGRAFLVYSTAEPSQVAAVQAKLGAERAATLVEDALALVAERIVASGVRRLVVAGGETSGAVVKALGVKALAIGPQIDPGVPWTASVGSEPRIALALKSGNFGAPDFFEKALALSA
jgi:uncharacterized protein YgbK (DUF1537 family)